MKRTENVNRSEVKSRMSGVFNTATAIARRAMMLALLAAALLATGCGGTDTSTPEAVARAAFDAVKANDYATYRKLCMTKETLLATMDAALATGEVSDRHKAGMETMKANIDKGFEMYEEELKEDFDDSVGDIDWSNLEIAKVDVDTERGDGVDQAEVELELSSGDTLRIRGMALTPSGWRISEDRPLLVRKKR